MVWSEEFLLKINDNSVNNFTKNREVLSFDEYIDDVVFDYKKHIKNSADYIDSMIEYFGSYDVETLAGNFLRYKIFDAEYFDNEGKIFGQELAQKTIINYIKNFCKLGKADKLILLHGPNGSSKSSIVSAISKGLEVYSKTKEGALYQFSWVFPKKEAGLENGFGFSKASNVNKNSFAHLSIDELECVIPCEKKDHPLLLLPFNERLGFLKKIDENMNIPEVFRLGDLSYKNRQIFDALLSYYHGSLENVYKHIRVERWYFSKKYRKGISVVEPQMSVDANLNQMSQNQSWHALPSVLRHLSLIEAMGPLVEANRGLIEYNDLLKRPLDSWKYLLVASEQASVGIGPICLTFDLIMLASSNELHLLSFKEYPDWPSFKGRIELVRVPYLLRAKDEAGIYKNQIPRALKGFHIAPHAIEMAARFAVLTRLEPSFIFEMSPNEKLELYDDGTIPLRLNQREANILKSQIKEIVNEYQFSQEYEGRYGASPREMMVLLLKAAQNKSYNHLSVVSVFEQIELLIEQKSSYEFLRREPQKGFKDSNLLLKLVKEHYGQILEDEVRILSGLFSKESYLELFKRYVLHVSSWVKKERLFDPFLQKKIEADEQFMFNIEKNLLATNEDSEDFRKGLIGRIGAFKLEHPKDELDYGKLFSAYLKRLKEKVYKDQFAQVEKILNAYLILEDGQKPNLEDKDYLYTMNLKKGFISSGYNEESAKSAVLYLLTLNKVNTTSAQEQATFGF